MIAVCCTAGAFANIMYHRLKTLNIDEQEKPKEPILAWSKCEVVISIEINIYCKIFQCA